MKDAYLLSSMSNLLILELALSSIDKDELKQRKIDIVISVHCLAFNSAIYKRQICQKIQDDPRNLLFLITNLKK